MRRTRLIMGMPVTVEIVDVTTGAGEAIDDVFGYFEYVDATFSTYRETSEISRINRGALSPADASADVRLIFTLAEQTRRVTRGYFDITRAGQCDPSGIVKGWAVWRAAGRLRRRGYRHFFVDAGGDIEVAGRNGQGQPWRVGIRDPFEPRRIVKVLAISDCGIATSGTYIRGDHIYDPHHGGRLVTSVVSMTVIGPNVYEADRFATAAFAMGPDGIAFIAGLEGFEGYMIDGGQRATLTEGFHAYVSDAAPAPQAAEAD